MVGRRQRNRRPELSPTWVVVVVRISALQLPHVKDELDRVAVIDSPGCGFVGDHGTRRGEWIVERSGRQVTKQSGDMGYTVRRFSLP